MCVHFSLYFGSSPRAKESCSHSLQICVFTSLCTLDLDYEQRRGLDPIWEFKILESSFKKNLRGTPLAIRDSGV